MNSERRKKILEQAWVGDAVLCLYARRAILRAWGAVDGARLQAVTSNRFLARFGEPSEVEAEIGRVYEAEGLNAAFVVIEEKMGSAFAKVLKAQGPPDAAPNTRGTHPLSRDSAANTCASYSKARRSPVATPPDEEPLPLSPPATEKRACS